MEKILAEPIRADEQTENCAVVRPFRNRHADPQACQHGEQETSKGGRLANPDLQCGEREKRRSQRERASSQTPAGVGKKVHVKRCRQTAEDADRRLELELAEKITRAQAEDELREWHVKLVEPNRSQQPQQHASKIGRVISVVGPRPILVIPDAEKGRWQFINSRRLRPERAVVRK